MFPHILLSGFLVLGFQFAMAAASAKTFPQPPAYYVLDEPKVLSAPMLHSVRTLLVEHDRLTGEQILVAIFDSLEGEDLVDWTNRLFTHWKIGKRGKDNGVLLSLYWKEHKARIEVGYGLEALLTDARSKVILSEVLIPALKENEPNLAISSAVVEILKTLESPLIQSGKAEEILRSGGGSTFFHRKPLPAHAAGWIVWVLLGLVLLVIVLNQLNSAEGHFTSMGWFRPKPWQRGRFHFWGWRGGGVPRYGGDGGSGWPSGWEGREDGFRGGGGLSGGGGASGDW